LFLSNAHLALLLFARYHLPWKIFIPTCQSIAYSMRVDFDVPLLQSSLATVHSHSTH
jgi:hypothetical protein